MLCSSDLSPTSHCVPRAYGYQVIVSPVLMGTKSLCPLCLWVPSHCVPRAYGYQVIVSPVLMGTKSLCPWVPSHCVHGYQPSHCVPLCLWVPCYFHPQMRLALSVVGDFWTLHHTGYQCWADRTNWFVYVSYPIRCITITQNNSAFCLKEAQVSA